MIIWHSNKKKRQQQMCIENGFWRFTIFEKRNRLLSHQWENQHGSMRWHRLAIPFHELLSFFAQKSWTIRWLAIERNKVKQGSHKHKNNSKKKTEIKWGERKERRRRKKCNRTAQHSTAQESNRKKKKLRLTLIYICLEQATSFTHQCEKLMWKFAFYFLGEQSTCV